MGQDNENNDQTASASTLAHLLFNFYAEYIMRNAGLEETQAGIKIAGRNINNLRYADDTTLTAESEEELKSLLMKVKEESEKVGLKLKLDLEKAEEPEIKLPTSTGSQKKQESSRKNIYFCFIDYAKAFDCVDHNKLWKILKEMGIPDHLICLLRNLYAGQEATVRTGHGTTDWFQIRKGVRQGCILSPCLFNLYAEYIMRNAGLEEAQAGIKISGRNINILRYADDSTLMAESEEELKSLLMKVKESEKVGLKLNFQKTKIMVSSPITSWQVDGETVETGADFVFLMLSFKSGFSLSSFTFIKRFFSSSSLSAIRVVSSAYLRLMMFLPAILIPFCASSNPAFLMMCSAYKLNKQSDSIQP